jgi:hypothetical protein
MSREIQKKCEKEIKKGPSKWKGQADIILTNDLNFVLIQLIELIRSFCFDT